MAQDNPFGDLIPAGQPSPRPSARPPVVGAPIYTAPASPTQNSQLESDRLAQERNSTLLPYDARKAAADAIVAEDKARKISDPTAADTTGNTAIAQKKAAAFLTRAIGSNTSYEELGMGPRSMIGESMAENAPDLLNSLPGVIGNSPSRQVADSAQNEFIAATLRMDSGAAIPEIELARQKRIYFPTPGDGPEAIQQKKEARLRAILGLKAAAGDLAAQAEYDADASRMGKVPQVPFTAGFDPTQADQGPAAPTPGLPGGPLKDPVITTDNPDEVQVGLERLDGRTEAQTTSDRIAAEVNELIKQGANPEQLEEYTKRKGYAPFSSWAKSGDGESFGDWYKRTGGRGGFTVAAKKIIYETSEARGDKKKPVSTVLGAAASNLFDPIGSGSEAIGGITEMLGNEGGGEEGAAFGRGAKDMMSLGTADEFRAVRDTAAEGGLTNFWDRYDQNVGEERATDDYDTEHNFKSRLAGQVAGSFALPSGVAGAGTRGAMIAGREAFAAARASGETLSAARAIARTAAAKAGRWSAAGQLAKEGAGVGAAYGFGSGRGLGDSFAKAGAGGVIGGVAGGSLGMAPIATRALIGEATGASRSMLQSYRTARAAKEEGVDLLPADVGGVGTRIATSIGAALPVSGYQITGRAIKSTEQSQAVLDQAAAKMGTAMDREAAGEAGRRGALSFIKYSAQRGGRLYDKAFKDSAGATVDATNARQILRDQIARAKQNPLTPPSELQRMQDLQVRLRQRLTVQGVRDMRTDMYVDPALRGTPAEKKLKDIVQAASDDIHASLVAQGKAGSAATFRQADNYWKARLDMIDDVLKPIIGEPGTKSGEDIIKALEVAARGDANQLDRFIKVLPPTERGVVQSSLITRLGRATDGNQNAAGDVFSLGTFLTNWSKLTPRAKSILAGTESLKSLNNLAEIATGARATSKFANSSRSGHVVGGAATLAPIVALDFATLGKTLAAQAALGKLLSSPKFAQWLAKAPEAKSPKSYIGLLSGIATRDPAITQDVLGFQKALMSFANDNAPKAGQAAASPDEGPEQQKRPQ